MPSDKEIWEQRKHYFSAYTLSLDNLERKALNITKNFLKDGPATVSVSWGKDSVAVAHIATMADPTVTIKWVRVNGLEPQDTLDVRDQFLEQHPHVNYVEAKAELPFMRGQAGFPGPNIDILGKHISGRTITGVRAAESKQRTLSAKVHGHTTKNTCRPILIWPTPLVFAYMQSRGLPIHRAYQNSFGGTLSLDDIRVHTLATATLYGSSYWDRITQWEDHYYGDTIRRELTRRVCQ